MQLNWQYLKYFAAVAQEEHITKAAIKLHLSQPALSKAMNNLEQDIGVPLFVKKGRNISLTSFGQVLKEEVLNATVSIENAVATIQAMADNDTGIVRVSSIFTIGSNFCPYLLNQYKKQDPVTSFQYTQKATADIIQDVIQEKIDVGFCGDFLYNEFRMDIERQLVLSEEMYIVVSKNHPLANKTSIKFTDVINETFIAWDASTGIALSIENVLRNAGIDPNLKFGFSATEDNTVAEMVRQDFGIALLVDSPSINMDGLHQIKINDISLTREIYMIWKKGNHPSPSVRSFMHFVMKKHAIHSK